MSTLTRTKPAGAPVLPRRDSANDGERRESLPAGWRRLPIRDLLDSLGQGWSPQCEGEARNSEDEWAVIKTTAVQSLQFRGDENKKLPGSLAPREHLELKPGDLLITRAGPRDRVGVTCLVKATSPRLIACDKVYRLRCKHNLVYPEFLELALNAPHVTDALNRLKTGISDSGVNLTQARFGELVIPVPPLEEQRKIVAEIEKQFTRLDAGVAALKRVQADLKRYRAAVLKAACEGKLVPTEAELARQEGKSYETAANTIGRTPAPPRPNRWATRSRDVIPGHAALAVGNPCTQLPEGWCWSALVDIASMRTGHTPSREHSEWWGGDILGLVLWMLGSMTDALSATHYSTPTSKGSRTRRPACFPPELCA